MRFEITPLLILYALTMIGMSIHLCLRLKRSLGERWLNAVSLMYALIYGLVPFLVHLDNYYGRRTLDTYSSLDYSPNGIDSFILTWAFSVIGYFSLCVGYRFYKHKKIRKNKTLKRSHSADAWYNAALCSFFIGIVSLYLWTNAYGGPIGVLKYAAALRSGWDIGISNPYTTMKRFVPLVQFSNIVFFALWFKKRKLSLAILITLSTVFSLLYLLANDGRAPLVMHVVAIIWIYLKIGQKRDFSVSFKSSFTIAIVSITALFVMHNMDYLSTYVEDTHADEDNIISYDLTGSIKKEFFYTVRSGQSIYLYMDENPGSLRIVEEIYSGFLGILPSSFRPSWLEKLEVINTRYWQKGTGLSVSGGRPPDMVVSGLYLFSYAGPFLFPFIVGIFLAFLEKLGNRAPALFDKEVFYALMLYPTLRLVGYANFDGLALNYFYILVGYLLLYIFDHKIARK